MQSTAGLRNFVLLMQRASVLESGDILRKFHRALFFIHRETIPFQLSYVSENQNRALRLLFNRKQTFITHFEQMTSFPLFIGIYRG